MTNYRLWVLLGWFSLLAVGARAQTNVTLAQQTFEGLATDQAYIANPFNTPAQADPFVALSYFELKQFNGSGGYAGTTRNLTNREGSYTWAAENVRGDGPNTYRQPGYVQLNSFSAANYVNLKMVVAFADPRGPSCAASGSCPRNSVSPTDRIRLQYSFDGGPFVTAGFLRGNAANSGYWQQDTSSPLDSIPEGTILNQDYKDITANISGTGTMLRVRVVCDSRGPELAFDNIRVMGDVDNSPKPALGALETTPASFTEGGSAIAVTGALTVGYSDGSATPLTGARVSISSNFVNGQDQLNYVTQGNITGTFGTNGVLTLSGNASQAAYQAALRTITYSNSNTTTLSTGTRQITFQVFNGTALSNTPARTINVTGVLNAPAALNYTENFDVDGEGTRYFGNAFANLGGSETGFFRATNSPATFNGARIGTATFTGWSGGYWFGEGTETTLNPTNPFGTVQLAPVNASGSSNLKFTIAVGTAGNWLGYFNSFNPGDSFELFYRVNGGTPVKFGAFYGVNGNTPARQDNDLDPLTPANGTQLSAVLQDFTFNLPAAAAVGNLDFILRQMTRGTSELAFDNIRITGTTPPTVTTALPGALTSTTALLGGTVTADGGGTITGRGVVYSNSNTNPTIGAPGTLQDANPTNGTGAFAETISGLAPVTTYYVRAYATNAVGTSYGAPQSFTTPTTIVSIVRAGGNPTNAASVSYTVTFGNSVTGVTAGNFSLTASGLTNASITGVSGSGTTRTVTVSTGTGDGTLRLNLSNTTGLSAGVSNALPFAGEVYTIDKTAPVTTTVGIPAGGTYLLGQVLSFTATYSEAVTVTGTPQMVLFIGGVQKRANYVSGSGTTALLFRYTVQSGDNDFNGVYPDGTLVLNGGTIRDAATNDANLRLNGVPTSSVLVDARAPTVTSLTGPAASGSTVSTAPFAFTVIFSEVVTNFSTSGITVTNGTVTGGPTGSNDFYTFTVTPTTPGTVTTVTIAAGAARDAVGLPSVASAPYSLTYQPPNVTVASITGRTPTPTATSTVTYKVTFSGSVIGLNASNFNLTTTGGVTGAAVASVSGSGANYIVTVNTGTGDGTLRLNLNNAAGTVPGINGLPTASGTVYTLRRNNLFAPNPQLTIQGSGSADGSGDVTAFVDLVQVLGAGGTPVAGALQNGSFETSNVGPAGYTYAPQVSAAPWTFSSLAGVARDGSGFGAADPPDGNAVAFLQGDASSSGSIGQKTALAGGSYQVRLQASQRNCCGAGPRDQELYVLVNGVCVGIFQPTNLSGYDPFTSLTFSVRATSRVAGQLLRFAGGNTPGYVDFSADVANPAPVLGTRYTQSAWIKPSIGTGSATYYVLGNGTGTTAAPYLAITGNGRLVAGYGNGSALNTVQTGPQIVPNGVWSLVTATYDASNLRIYLNGELKITQAYGVLPVSTRVSYVGSSGPSGTGFFPGDIDEVSQWSRALSQAEIRQLRHLTLSGAENGLVSYLQLNDAGPTTTDFVSGTVGTLTGATRVTSTAPVGSGTSNLQVVAANTTYNFPGTNVGMAFTGVTGSSETVVFRLDGQPLGTQPSATGLQRTYTPVYWIVNKYTGGTFASANVTYTLTPADISAADAATPANLKLFKRESNADGAFDAPISATAANATAGTVTFPVTSFSQTVIATFGSSPLPVELTAFTAERRNNEALLQWTTAQELNNDRFEVESSVDARTFRAVGQVAGQGTSAQRRDYQFTDANLARYQAPVVYYRLRQVDRNGTATLSPVRTVQVPKLVSARTLTVFPNPAADHLTVRLSSAYAGTAQLQLYDVQGRTVISATRDLTGAAGSDLRLSVSELPSGAYTLRVVLEDQVLHQRLVVQR